MSTGGTSECEWRTIRLGDICSIITKGTTPKSYEKTGIAFIKTEAFVGRYIDKSKLSFVSAETHNGFLKRSILQENDILFTIAGATIGKMAIVTADILPANTNQACAIIRLRNDNDLGYVKYILESVFMKIYMKQCIKGSAQPNLNLQQLNDFKFPYPITNKKIEIVSILDRFDKLCNDISEGLPAEIEARRKQYEYANTNRELYNRLIRWNQKNIEAANKKMIRLCHRWIYSKSLLTEQQIKWISKLRK